MKKLIPQLLGFTPPKPTKTGYTVLRQLVQWIPPGMIQRLADEHKLDIRKWSAVSHVVRQKANMRLQCVRRLPQSRDASVIGGELVAPVLARSRKRYPVPLRRVAARVEVWVKRDRVAILKTHGTAPRPKPGEPREEPPPLQVFFDHRKPKQIRMGKC